MKRVVIVQARTSSTRLRGKIMADLAGRPLLSQELRRLKASAEINEIVIATTNEVDDDPVVDLARREGVRWFRGDEHDVLARFLGAARESGADMIVRVTADCPLIDAAELDRVVQRLSQGGAETDYAANVIRRTFPRGLDVEAMFRDVLERLHRMAQSAKAREHVTWFLNRERPDLFARLSVEDEQDNSDLRWTVDTAEDLDLARRIYAGMGLSEELRGYREILAHVRARPELVKANAHISQKDS
jgi:spore coat polysaccharide biosynthesis protein SpsF